MNRFFFAAVILTLVSGCEIFSVRDAEPPVVSRSSFEFPSTPQIAVVNLVASLKEQNIDNYMTTLCDTAYSTRPFIYIPAGGSATIYPKLATSWNLSSERKYLQNLFAQTKSAKGIQLTLTNSLYATYGDSTIFSARYALDVPKRNSDIVQQYAGEVRVTFILDGRLFWTICTWQDINTSNGQCWSDLRGQYF